jgi:kinesin family protein C2/C3
MRAREEKYKSRIRVLEALASSISGQTQINSSATNGKANVGADHVKKVCFLSKSWLPVHITILYIYLS